MSYCVGVVFVLCASLSLLNDSSLLLVWTLSMGWKMVFLCYCSDLSSFMAMPLSDCAVLVVWSLLAITYCFADVSAHNFSVKARGLYVPVYSFVTFTTIYACSLDVWCCRPLSRLLSLLLSGLLRLF